jgi:D-alanyl-D-alanine carboxypeptidase
MRKHLIIGASIVAASLVVGVVTSVPASASHGGHGRDRLQSKLDELVAIGLPGASLYLRVGHHEAHLTSGTGEVATATPMRPDDHFKIASLTKTYTSAVVMRLVEQGRLRLEDPVSRWLSDELVPNGEHITVRQLLSHTSGLFDFEADPRVLAPYLNGDLAHFWSSTELVQMATSHPPLFPPGQTDIAVYSNTNYVVAGLIVEAVTGQSFADVLESHVLRSLHLDETSYPTEPGMPAPYAHGYLALGAPPSIDVTGLSPSLTSTSGAMVSTMDDLADFYRALLTGRVVDRHLLRQMKDTRSEGTKVDIPGQRYGMGLESFPTTCGHLAWGHNGVVPGYMTFIFSSEDGHHQAALMINHDAQTAPEPTGAAFYALLDQAFCSTYR